MHFFFGGSNQQDKKINNEFITQIKTSLTNQFCQFCNKQPSTKVSFVPQLKKGFTCNKCELSAVGNDFKNLAEKTLITNEKLSQTVTKALINYQNIQSQSPQQVKQIENEVKSHLKTSNETAQKIKGEMKLLKLTTQNKLNQLVKTSQTQNSSILFEQLIKKSQQKKPNTQEVIQILCKKSLVNNKGLHFIDTEQIQKMNSQVDQRVSSLKSQLKIKLKQIDELTSWINGIEL